MRVVIEKNYFLLRQSLKDIPHAGDNNLTQEIRSVSKVISDTVSPFPRFEGEDPWTTGRERSEKSNTVQG